MIDTRAMAFVNLYGVLATLENLCSIDNQAKEVVSKLSKPVSLCFDVKNGPCATLHFSKDGCRFAEGSEGCTCKMNFNSPAAFNNLIDNSKPGIPTKNPVQVLSFLLGPFTALTNRLTEILRPTPEALQDRAFFELNTILTFYTIVGGISALANTDPISLISAGNTVDGDIHLGIAGIAAATICVKDHHFTTIKEAPATPRAKMEFATIDLANSLFAGTASTINELCKGNIRLSGMISMVDNVNRILDRVSDYLA